MDIFTKESLLKDLDEFRSKGYKKRLIRTYNKIPKTSCRQCGLCCYDSPYVTYPEFLLVLDYVKENLDKELLLDIYKKSIKHYVLGIISKECPCAFLHDNTCLIYSVSPVACKRWGLQTKESYERDLARDHKNNENFAKYYSSLGITIPDEVITSTLPYCEKVTITENKYRLYGNEIEKMVMKDLKTTFKAYSNKMLDSSVDEYFAIYILGKDAGKIRLRLLQEYQKGNLNAIKEYIDNLNLEDYLF